MEYRSFVLSLGVDRSFRVAEYFISEIVVCHRLTYLEEVRRVLDLAEISLEFKCVYNRGKLRLAIHENEGAVADLDKATTIKPEHPKAHELFGDALFRVGKENEAELQWRIAKELKNKIK